MKTRYCVQKFSEAMEKRLAANDHKGGWTDEQEDFLWSKLVEEISELRQAVDSKKRNEAKVLREAADTANIIMMIADISTWRSHPLQEPD